jgi:predicted lipase
MNIINIPYATTINYRIPRGIGLPMYLPLALNQMIQPGYNFKTNDLMYLGSTLWHKINYDQQRINKIVSERLKKPTEETINKNIEKTESIDDLFKQVSKSIKESISDNSVNKLMNEIDSFKEVLKKGDLIDTSGNKLKNDKNTIEGFERTIKFIVATKKLLEKAPELLKKTYSELGINVNDPEVSKFLKYIEDGFKKIISLEEMLNNTNIVLTNDQNMIILEFLKKALEGIKQ